MVDAKRRICEWVNRQDFPLEREMYKLFFQTYIVETVYFVYT